MKAKMLILLSSFCSTYTYTLNKIYTCESTHIPILTYIICSNVCFRIVIESYLSQGFNQKNNIEFKLEFDKIAVIIQVLNKSNWVMKSPLQYMAVTISGGTEHIKLLIMTRMQDFANFSSLRIFFPLLNEVSTLQNPKFLPRQKFLF